MKPVIALDLGNFVTMPCCIKDFDPENRNANYQIINLLLPNNADGIPSAFFSSDSAAQRAKERGTPPPPWCGFEAVTGKATPYGNRTFYLKRNLGKPLVLDSWEGSYDEAMKMFIEYVVRYANRVLQQQGMEESNQVILAHPATFTLSRRIHFKELAEQSTLADGTHIEVVGMIAEPAAAALDYLASLKSAKDTTVLVYDLGGGTFDLALVSLYPQGRQDSQGNTYYYDIELTDGIEDLGGKEFTEVMLKIMQSKIPEGKVIAEDLLRDKAEEMKKELTDSPDSECTLFCNNGEPVTISVTRDEFENSAKTDVQKTIEKTRKMLDRAVSKPDSIILTGGASQMPVIMKEVEESFPEYKGKIHIWKPSQAVAHGAARYGTNENHTVLRHLDHEIGIGLYEDDKEFVRVGIQAHTDLPCSTDWRESYTREDGQSGSTFPVYESKDSGSNYKDPKTYTRVMSVTLQYAPVPKGTAHETRLHVDEHGILTVEAREKDNPENHVENTVTLNPDSLS